jgi:ribosomal protein L16/L10AE
MSLSFGKCVSLAAQVKEGNTIFIVAVMTKELAQKARKVLKDAKEKLPIRIEIVDISPKQ